MWNCTPQRLSLGTWVICGVISSLVWNSDINRSLAQWVTISFKAFHSLKRAQISSHLLGEVNLEREHPMWEWTVNKFLSYLSLKVWVFLVSTNHAENCARLLMVLWLYLPGDWTGSSIPLCLGTPVWIEVACSRLKHKTLERTLFLPGFAFLFF